MRAAQRGSLEYQSASQAVAEPAAAARLALYRSLAPLLHSPGGAAAPAPLRAFAFTVTPATDASGRLLLALRFEVMGAHASTRGDLGARIERADAALAAAAALKPFVLPPVTQVGQGGGGEGAGGGGGKREAGGGVRQAPPHCFPRGLFRTRRRAGPSLCPFP